MRIGIGGVLLALALACAGVFATSNKAARSRTDSPSPWVAGIRSGAGGSLAGSPRQSPPSVLPLAAEGPISAAIGRSDRSYLLRGLAAANRSQDLKLHFTERGVWIASSGSSIRLALGSFGRGTAQESLPAARPQATANRVLYRRGSVHEWYLNGPFGLEQGFDVARRPAGRGPLGFTISLAGARHVKRDGAAALLLLAGGTALRYGGVSASDARGRSLPARLSVAHGRISILVDDSGARYPLRIDPFVQQGSKLQPTDESGNGEFGVAVALSSDGNTAAIGAPDDNMRPGAVFIFVRSSGTWSEQAKLVGSGAVGTVGEIGEGFSVALSADGNTVLFGAEGDNSSAGAAWVFVRSGTSWSQQGAKIVPADTVGGSGSGVQFGYSAALSSDGNTALIGGRGDNSAAGAAWVYVRSNGTWSEQQKLTSSNSSDLGASVALSSDGNTALIGEPGQINTTVPGAVVFIRSSGVWSQQGSELVGTGAAGTTNQGNSVALSSDGNTALIAGDNDNSFVGATWVFVRSNGSWSQQGNKLVGSQSGVTSSQQGASVALTGDGNTALIGEIHGTGGAWVFTRSGTTWSQQGGLLQGSGASGTTTAQGSSVALSSDGTTAMLGGPHDTSPTTGGLVGAAWAFGNAPTVSSVSPSSGPAAGGTSVTITGTNLANATAVKFGSTSASINTNTATQITATAPAESAGTVHVTVTTAGGTSTTSANDQYTYTAPPGAPVVTGINPTQGPTTGGTSVTIDGTNLDGATVVTFGSTPGAIITDAPSQIIAVSPAGSVGTVDVTVMTSAGTSATDPADQFTYVSGGGSGGGALQGPAVVTGAPSVLSSTTAALVGTVIPEGLATTAYFEYGLDSRYTQPGTAGPTYTNTTPAQAVGSDFNSHPVSGPVSGLVPNALYHVRLVATNAAGTATGPDQTFMTTQDPPPPPPVLGQSFNAAPVSGLVFIKLPGSATSDRTGGRLIGRATLTKGVGFIPLTEARQLPTGTQVDARAGKIQLNAAASTKHGKLQNGTFNGGLFKLSQDRSGLTKGLTTLSLLEGAFTGAPTYGSCKKKALDPASPSAVAALSSSVLQTLRSSAHGKFRTRGRYSAATVRGTAWTMSDRCDGTLVTVQRDTVAVQDFVRHVTVVVRAGHRYLARAP
jgi:hypothetical protein